MLQKLFVTVFCLATALAFPQTHRVEGSHPMAQTPGMEHREDRRDDRQGDRDNRQDDRQGTQDNRQDDRAECRDEEGVGIDKNMCRREERRDRVD